MSEEQKPVLKTFSARLNPLFTLSKEQVRCDLNRFKNRLQLLVHHPPEHEAAVGLLALGGHELHEGLWQDLGTCLGTLGGVEA